MKTREQSFDADQFVLNCIDSIARAYQQNKIEEGLTVASGLLNKFITSKLSKSVFVNRYAKIEELVSFILIATSQRYPLAQLIGAKFFWCKGAFDEALKRFEQLNENYPNYLEGYLQHKKFLIAVYPRGAHMRQLERKIKNLEKNANDKPNTSFADPLFGYSLFGPCLSSAVIEEFRYILNEAAKSTNDVEAIKNDFCTIS